MCDGAMQSDGAQLTARPAWTHRSNSGFEGVFRTERWEYVGRSTVDEPYDIENIGVPNRIRTGVAAVKGRCPRPLDDGDEAASGAMV